MNGLEAFLVTVIPAATPLLLAAVGELVVERAGVLNLGVEGMMATGAVCAFVVAHISGNPWLGVLAGALAGALISTPFAALTQKLAANQVATGLALALFGLGVAGLIGESYVGQPGVRLPALNIPVLSALPFLGPVLFSHDVLVYASFVFTALVSWFLFRTRAGLMLRAVGVNHDAAHALGHPVVRIRVFAILFGGALAGLAGAHLSLAYTPQWVENMTAGRGWIALALVVFATWRPWRVLAGAYLFGTVWILGLHLQAAGIGLPSQLLSALPYLATVVALVIISRNRVLTLTNTPASLGKPFVPER